MTWATARALSDDLRGRVLKASAAGLSARQTAARFGVGISTAIRWNARARTGETTAPLQGRRRVSRLDVHEALLVRLIEERKDIALNEIMARLVAERAVIIGHSALSSWLRTHGWRFKKTYGPPPLQGCSRTARSGLHQRIRSQACAWPRWNPRGLGLIKTAASSATFLTRLPRRRFDRCAISPSPSQI